VVHTINHQVCNDDVRKVWERFVSLMSIDSLISHIFSSPTFSLQYGFSSYALTNKEYKTMAAHRLGNYQSTIQVFKYIYKG